MKKNLYERKKMGKKYPSKIITNPIYEGGTIDLNEFQEYCFCVCLCMFRYQQSESEIRLRKALLANEKKKNKAKKEEEKKEKKKEEKEETDNEEENEEEEKENQEPKKIQDDDDEDDEEANETQSSVTSGSTGSTIRSFYSLRTAIDEKFVPRSIRNLRCAANIIFLLLLGLASNPQSHI
jgi:hypothetical protein